MKGLSITWRILGVNAFIMTALVIGVITVGDAREKLVTMELADLVEALEDGPPDSRAGDGPLDPDTALFQWRHLPKGGAYSLSFEAAADPFPDPSMTGIHIPPPDDWLETLVAQIPLSDRFLPLVGGHVFMAMPSHSGQEPQLTAWRTQDQRIVLSAQRTLKDGSGQIVFKTRTVTNEVMRNARLSMARFILLGLVLNLVMAIYLAARIGRPLNDLARAARTLSDVPIPDLSNRGDEIGDLSLALRSMVEQLHRQRDDMQRFAADVAHELKNPLASLRSAASGLGAAPSPADQATLCAIIDDDVRRMDRLITDIARLTRLDATLPAELADNVTDIRPLLMEYERQGMCAAQIEDGSFPLLVPLSQDHLRQVMDNLLVNAQSFHRGPRPVRLHVQTNAEEIIVTIDDDGPGIPPGMEEKIFDRFYSERAGHAAGRHSGLGLAIVRRILDHAQARIQAENRHAPDGTILGARFVIHFRHHRKIA